MWLTVIVARDMAEIQLIILLVVVHYLFHVTLIQIVQLIHIVMDKNVNVS